MTLTVCESPSFYKCICVVSHSSEGVLMVGVYLIINPVVTRVTVWYVVVHVHITECYGRMVSVLSYSGSARIESRLGDRLS
jgi:hypothetical protein